MKQFLVQALVDDRHVWDLMKHLEAIKAVNILARPHGDAEKPNGGTRAAPGGGETITAQVRRAILDTIEKTGEATSSGVRKATGLPRPSVDRMFWTMNKDGFIKRTGLGKYTKGKKAP